MGSDKVTIASNAKSRRRFSKHLLEDLKALEWMLEKDLFEKGVTRIGAEQELCFVNKNWQPAPVFREVLEKVNDEHYTTEYLRFNMEINLDPQVFTGGCLSQLESDLIAFIQKGERAANAFDTHVIQTGILPTISRMDVVMDNLTPLKRYFALTEKLKQMRGGVFEFRIEGADQLITKTTNTLFEGCNTSFQVHYQVHPKDFVTLYNWAQAITAPLMAASTNSPLFLGKKLWRETRIALFQQSIDTRKSNDQFRVRNPRVSFGSSWLKRSVTEIYREAIARFSPVLITTEEEEPMLLLAEGKIPKLRALNIQNGTVYKWNRACYGITDGKPHLRIENRILPAGPSSVDQVANAAFWLGMMHGIPAKYKQLSTMMDFDDAKSNFIQAARQGLGAYFRWPGYEKRIPAEDLILRELIPIAKEGLKKAKIDQTDIEKYLDIIEERVLTGKTGSQWLLDSFSKIKKQASKFEALTATTAGLFRRQQENIPVHEWELADLSELGQPAGRFKKVEQIMSTDLYTALEDDLIEMVSKLMEWQKIKHVPIENERGELVGIVTSSDLIHYYGQDNQLKAIKEIMSTNLTTINLGDDISKAIQLMQENQVSCLPVVQFKRLVGILTESDILRFSSAIFEDLQSPSVTSNQ